MTNTLDHPNPADQHPLVLVRGRKFGSASRKTIALLLADCANNQDWRCWPSQEVLAARAELSLRTVNSILSEFEAEGIIRRSHRYSATTGHRLSDDIWLSPEAIMALPPTCNSPHQSTEPTVSAPPPTCNPPRAYVQLTAESEDHSFSQETPVETPSSLPSSGVTPVTPSTPDQDFEFFWSLYPRRKEKAAARKKWDQLIKAGASPDAIIAGVRLYAAEKAGEDPQFIKHATTWLNKGCWEDEPDPTPKPKPSRNGRTLGDKAAQYDRVLGLLGEAS